MSWCLSTPHITSTFAMECSPGHGPLRLTIGQIQENAFRMPWDSGKILLLPEDASQAKVPSSRFVASRDTGYHQRRAPLDERAPGPRPRTSAPPLRSSSSQELSPRAPVSTWGGGGRDAAGSLRQKPLQEGRRASRTRGPRRRFSQTSQFRGPRRAPKAKPQMIERESARYLSRALETAARFGGAC